MTGCVPLPVYEAHREITEFDGMSFCAEPDRDALVAFYEATGGPSWVRDDNWLSNDVPIEEWYGVSTDGNGRVTRIRLSENGLRGEIPAEVGTLERLHELTLSLNSLTGVLPPELGNLPQLELLILWENRLSGEIPPEVGKLSNLQRLFLNNNRFSGEIPTGIGPTG